MIAESEKALLDNINKGKLPLGPNIDSKTYIN